MSTSFADRKKQATSAVTEVYLCLDLELHNRRVAAYRELERRRKAAQRDGDDESNLLDTSQAALPDAVAKQLAVVDEIDAELEVKSEPYVLRKAPEHKRRELIEKYPASEDAVAKAKEQRAEVLASTPDISPEWLHRLAPVPDVDPDAFWPEAIALCSHEPQLTVEDVLWLRDGDDDWTGLPPDEFAKLIGAYQELHGSGVQVPKELLRIAAAMPRGQNGTTPAAKESPSRSSAAGSRKKTNRTG